MGQLLKHSREFSFKYDCQSIGLTVVCINTVGSINTWSRSTVLIHDLDLHKDYEIAHTFSCQTHDIVFSCF